MKNGTRKWITILSACVAAVLLVHASWDYLAGRALSRALREQARRGYPSSMRDLLPGAFSERTDASVPLAKAFALIDQGRGEGRGRYAVTMRLLAYHDGSRPSGPPSFALPLLDANHKKALWQVVDSDVMRPVYELLEEASNRPNCRFEPDLSLGVAAVPADVLAMKSCIQLLMLRSWLNTDAGRHGAAAADIASALRLCAFLESYPLLVTQLQRASAAGMALGRLAEALVAAPPGALSPSDLGELDLAVNLVRDVDRVGIARAIDGQRIMYGAWLGDRLLKGRALSEIGATAPRLLKWYSWYPARPMLKHEMKAFIRAMADGREFVRAPRSARKKLRDPSSGVGASKPLTKDLLPSFSRIGDRMDVFDTVVEQARAALVLARFRNENRRYPKDWSETGAGEIPDPMGGTLGYHATAASYLITSVGLNGRDEGGEGDDVVWPGRR